VRRLPSERYDTLVVRASIVLLGFGILLALAGWAARRNRIDADLVNLLPRDAPAAAGMDRYARLFGRDETIVGLIEGDDSLARANRIDHA